MLAACGTNVPRLDDAPVNSFATPVGYRGIRYWGDAELKKLNESSAVRLQELREAHKADPTIPLERAYYLAISGGGGDGAYGAGILTGWTKAGTRPKFEVVTGISTGALTAPYAFLGPEYDGKLKEIYTTISDKDVLRKTGPLGAVFGSSLTDNSPLKALVAKYVTLDLLDKIAIENDKGRLLLIGTTNLDAQRPVVWNMTAIAASGNPNRLQLFRDVLIASAAIPGVFPPQLIKVQADGKLYEELHVDGGTTTQAFLVSGQNSLKEVDAALKFPRKRSLYVIINGTFAPQAEKTETKTLAIAARSISTLIKSQSIGDVYKMYAQSQRDDVDFNLTSIPGDFTAKGKSEFDQVYMRKLYDLGFDLGQTPAAWSKTPPDYNK
ncbi:patatin-like phospholipase family protein [Aestuariivirga sp.]|uniref:patatin-like phospholipase family protein n=1 Tax=Aestuariivirga sp. TaxID=2650926 RepID=UPI003BAD833B